MWQIYMSTTAKLHLKAKWLPLFVNKMTEVMWYISKACVCSQSCLTLCNPTDYGPSDSSIPGILQARILKWIAISYFTGSSQPRDRTQVSHVAGGFFTSEPPGEIQTQIGLKHYSQCESLLHFVKWNKTHFQQFKLV